MADGPPGRRPEYKVYRSRRGPFDNLRKPELNPLRGLLRRRRGRDPRDPHRAPRRRVGARRVVRWLLLAALGWILLSAVIFMISAQLTAGVSDSAEDALASGGSLLTGSTILVLGSDERPKGTLEPGAGGPGRADSILLLRVGFGSVKRLSILRDSYTDIPGHGPQKINASYALGGPALTIRTVEEFLGNGLRVNHVIEVNFEDFPDFIDALGGVDVTLRRCVSSAPFGGRRFRLRRGEHRLNGRQALAFARVRKNRCTPNEDDRARARRQQQVLSAIRSRTISPGTFVRLPLVAWAAPRTIRSDMRGPGLTALFTDIISGGDGSTHVLRPSGNGPAGSLIVSDGERARAVRALLR